MSKHWNTDEFFSDWIRSTKRFGYGFAALVIWDLVWAVFQVRFWSPISAVVLPIFVIGGVFSAYMAYWNLVTRPAEIERDWLDFKAREARLDQTIKKAIGKQK